MNQNRWTGILVTTFCLALIILAFMSRKPLCIESNIIERIDRVTATSQSTAYACRSRQQVPFDTKLSEQIPRFEAEIKKVESFLQEFASFQNQILLVWHDDSTNVFRWRGDELHISNDHLNRPNWIARSLIKSWLRLKLSSQEFSGSPAEESLTDLFVSLYQEESRDSFLNEAVKWPLSLKSLRSYCFSRWVSLEHLSLCKSVTESPKKSVEGIFPMSVRPLMTQALLEAWKNLGSTEKYHFVRDFNKGLEPTVAATAPLKNKLVLPLSLKDEGGMDLEASIIEIEKLTEMIRNFSLSYTSWNHFYDLFEQALTRRGFSTDDGGAFLDVAFLIPNFDDSDRKADWLKYFNHLSSQFPQLLIGVLSDQSLWVLPAEESVSRKIIPQIRAKRAVSINCQLPDLKHLVSFSKNFEKILLVNDCEKTSQLKFWGYLKNGVESFANDNKDVGFVQLHLPSLVLAWRNENVNPLPLLAQEKWKDQFFKSLGWRDPQYDERLQFYKTRSVIEAIEAYRIKN